MQRSAVVNNPERNDFLKAEEPELLIPSEITDMFDDDGGVDRGQLVAESEMQNDSGHSLRCDVKQLVDECFASPNRRHRS